MKLPNINNKGEGSAVFALWAIVAIAMVALGWFAFGTPKEQSIAGIAGKACSVDSDCSADGTLVCQNSQCAVKQVTGIASGKAATYEVYAYSKSSNQGKGSVQNGTVGLYAVTYSPGSSDKSIVANNANLLDTGSYTLSGLSTGKKIDAIAFRTGTTNGFYGELTTKDIVQEADTLNLATWGAINSADNIDIDFQDENGLYQTQYPRVNVTITGTSGDTYKFKQVRITNNQTDLAWNFAGIGIDIPETSNLTENTFGSSNKGSIATNPSGTKPIRLASTEYFYPATPTLLFVNDEILIDSFILGSTGAVGNGNTAGEAVTLRFIDWSHYLTQTQQIATGYEDDTLNHADVGTGDITVTLNVTSAFA